VNAFREDADLAIRLLADGWQLQTAQRETVHPVRPGGLRAPGHARSAGRPS
jgi:hypothetical protein